MALYIVHWDYYERLRASDASKIHVSHKELLVLPNEAMLAKHLRWLLGDKGVGVDAIKAIEMVTSAKNLTDLVKDLIAN